MILFILGFTGAVKPLIAIDQVSTDQAAAKLIYAHLMIHDPQGAIQVATNALKQYPESKVVHLAYIRALAEMGNETAMLQQWAKTTHQFQEEKTNRLSLEVLAWGVLNKGESSDQVGVRLNALLGAALTQDVRALPLLIRELKSTNAMLRSLAVKLSSMYGDAPLQQELMRLLKEEKVWYVRLEVIKAIGVLRMTSVRDELKEIIGDSKTLAEEKTAATLALVKMYDSIGVQELRALMESTRAGLRQLACELVVHLGLQERALELSALIEDTSPDVRLQALYSLGLLKVTLDAKKMGSLLEDSSPDVAITAAWYATIQNQPEGINYLQRWLQHPQVDFQRKAAAALSVTGKAGRRVMSDALKSHPDPYVRANLAIGMIGEQADVQFACDSLFSIFFTEKDRLWMWDDRMPFRSLAPSDVSHIDQVANYPHVIDQLTRLEILSMLSVMHYPKAQEAMKGFLKNESWGVSGAAAGILLEEGDEDALELVRGLLNEKDQKVRVQAALLLATLGKDPLAVKTLQEAYGTVDREMKVYILEALGHIGAPESVPFLIEILKEPFQLLRVVAASALIQSLYH